MRTTDRGGGATAGLKIRAGVHTGEVQTVDGKIAGMTVVIGARVGAKAGASDVLVSQTVKDLVAGLELPSRTPASTS